MMEYSVEASENIGHEVHSLLGLTNDSAVEEFI